MGGPLGAILGYAFASMNKDSNVSWKQLNPVKIITLELRQMILQWLF